MKALRPQPSGEVVVEELGSSQANTGRTPPLARQLRTWIAFLCIAWGFLGFLAGTWFGGRSKASARERAWFEEYADRLTAEFELDEGQHARLVGYLSDYDRSERERRASYALEMERDRKELAALGNSMYRTLLEEIVTDEPRRDRLRTLLKSQERPLIH